MKILIAIKSALAVNNIYVQLTPHVINYVHTFLYVCVCVSTHEAHPNLTRLSWDQSAGTQCTALIPTS